MAARTQAESIGLLQPDLQYLLESEGVSSANQAAVAEAGYVSVRLFSLAASTVEEAKAWARDALGQDPATGPAARLANTMLVAAWEVASTRRVYRNKVEAEATVDQQPRQIPRRTWSQLKTTFEANHYTLEEDVTPSSQYFDYKSEQLESGELVAESLKLMTTEKMMEGWDQEASVTFDTKGALKVRRSGNREIALPTSPEELRTRLKVHAHCMLLLKIRSPNTPWLAKLHPYDFDLHVEHVLGEQIAGLKIESRAGILRPTLNLVLEYEYQVRKKAVKLVIESGATYKEALRTSRELDSLRTRYFTTPLTVLAPDLAKQHSQRRSSPLRLRSNSRGRSRTPPLGVRGGGKGGGRGRSGGRGRGVTTATTTPDGRPICFRFNNKDERCRGPCRFAHVCIKCYGPHPAHMCRPAYKPAAAVGGPRPPPGPPPGWNSGSGVPPAGAGLADPERMPHPDGLKATAKASATKA